MKSLFAFLPVSWIAASAACHPGEAIQGDFAGSGSGTKLAGARVLAIAKQAVAENDTWLDRAVFDVPRRDAETSTWEVMVKRQPPTPGGFRLITINDGGQVMSYHRGS